MIHLDNGTMVTVLPHGVLFRVEQRAHKKYLIEDKNYLMQLFIGHQIFFGRDTYSTIVLKNIVKIKNIIFIDASKHLKNKAKCLKKRY